MIEMVEANWLAFALALLIGLLIAWWLFGRAAHPRERYRSPDALDEGAVPAQRNQALIDAPPAAATAASFAGTGPDILAGLGEIMSAFAADEVTAAGMAGEAGEPDDLRRIKGVGPKLVAMLHALAITRYAQIAAWTDEDIDRIDPQLGPFAGRIRRDQWVEQAQLLAAGDVTGFEERFGKV